MKEYIIGGIFFVMFSVFLYILGSVIILEEKKYSFKFVIGYIIYSFFVSVFGILVQVLQMSWSIFEIYMIILLLTLFIFCIYRIKKHGISVIPSEKKEFLSNHWFIFLLLFFLMVLTMFHYKAYWFNNHLDDGFYINKMAMFPYVKNPFAIIPSTGLSNDNYLNSYILNTHELEASFYLYFLKITPTLYARFFLSGFHYFLLINCIYAFSEKLLNIMGINGKQKFIQYIPAIVILFAFNELFLRDRGILFLQDSNQFANAMYYGSSVVRTMGIMLLILPFLEEKKISLKMIIEVICISIVLLSKSTIALPIILVTSLSYTLITFLYDGKKGKIFFAILIALIIAVDYVLRGNMKVLEISNYAFQNLIKNMRLIGFIPVVLVLIFSFFYKKETIYKLNLILILIFILTTLPFFNNIISLFSFYAFVAGRTFTCFYYTICIIACIYAYIFCFTVKLKNIFIYFFSGVSVLSLSFGNICSIQQAGGSLFYEDELYSLDLIDALRVIKNNNKFIPNSSIELGKILKRLSLEKNENVNVICRELNNINGSAYALATSLTSVAPQVISVSAKIRYGGESDRQFVNYSNDDQSTFEKFMFQLDDQVYQDFKDILEKYPINCVILVVDDKDEYMQELGFKLYDSVIDADGGVSYFVYEKE